MKIVKSPQDINEIKSNKRGANIVSSIISESNKNLKCNWHAGGFNEWGESPTHKETHWSEWGRN